MATVTQEQIDRARVVDVALLAERLVELKRSGLWRIGPCPLCGGVDRFNVNTEINRWLCRNCTEAKYRDAIDLQMKLHNQTFPEAVAALLGEAPAGVAAPPPAPPPAPFLQPPAEPWQTKARAFIEESITALWSPVGQPARHWLTTVRGLTEPTLYRWRIGFNPQERFEPLAEWGLPAEGTARAVWLPRGVVLPCEIGGQVWRIKVHRGGGDPKMPFIKGSCALALLGVETCLFHPVAVAAEGEMDFYTVWQTAGDALACFTVGAQGYPLDVASFGKWLLGLRRVLVAYDMDDRSEIGVAKALQLGERMARITVPRLAPDDKDINDYHRKGGDVRAWLLGELAWLDGEVSWPLTVVWPPDTRVGLVRGMWCVLPSGEIEATYPSPRVLQLALAPAMPLDALLEGSVPHDEHPTD